MKTLGIMAASVVALVVSACGDDGSTGGGGSGASVADGGGDDGGSDVGGSDVGGSDVGGSGGDGGGAPTCGGTQSADPRLSAAADQLRELLDAHHLAGGALAIVKDGEILDIAVAGSKKQDECNPVTPDTLFGVGWATPLVTAVAALDVVEDGELDLDAPMTEVVEDLHVGSSPYGDASQVTMHQLLTRTSMLSVKSDNTWGQGYPDRWCYESLEDLVGDENEPVLYATPGSMQDTNAQGNMELAGLALEKVDGRPFPEIVKTRVLDPLEMGGGFDAATIEASDHAEGGNPDQPDCLNRHPSTGYHGSVRDMAKLLAYLTGGAGDVLAPATRDGMLSGKAEGFWTEPFFAAYGPDGIYDERIDDEVIFMSGDDGAFEQDLVLFRDRGLAVILLVNGTTGPSGEAIQWTTWKIAQIYDESIDVEEPQPDFIPVDPATFPSLVGTYRTEAAFNGIAWRQLDVFIDEQDGGLVGTLSSSNGGGGPVTFTRHYTPDNFTYASGGHQNPVRFWRDEAGDGHAIQLFGDSGPPFYRMP